MVLDKIPKVGQLAPDFELPDSSGTPQRLSSLASQGPLVLLFYRGYW
jgi:peroxiredoxin